jgi:hypothetical protein
MKSKLPLYLITFFFIFSNALAEGRDIFLPSKEFSDNEILNEDILNLIKKRFNGRIVSFAKRSSINDSNCIDGDNTTLCKDKNGNYTVDNSYMVKVQVNNKQIIISVVIDADTGEILEVMD